MKSFVFFCFVISLWNVFNYEESNAYLRLRFASAARIIKDDLVLLFVLCVDLNFVVRSNMQSQYIFILLACCTQ